MGAGIHGGFGYTKGYIDSIAMSAIIVNPNRTNERLHIFAKNIKKEKGFYDIVIHGEKNTFMIYNPNTKSNKRTDYPNWTDISHRTLSKYIKSKKDYKGEAIRLISCHTGELSNGVAQNLANKLKVIVKAPSDTVWVHPNGTLSIGKTDIEKNGHWNYFYPKINK